MTTNEFSFRTRQHDWDQLKNNPDQILNVVIVGGGIVGAGILREFSLRNIPNVYLFEKNDFASGTSGASSKLIHAGIRYLEQAWVHLKHRRIGEAWRNFLFVLGASRERKILGDLAPHLIKPKPIYLVVAESDERSVFSVFLGVWLYYFIQIFQGQFFSRPRIFFRKDALRWATPELSAEKVKAVFSFWDSETDDARLVIENLQSANSMGGGALNYVELLAYRKIPEGTAVKLKNIESGEIITVKTKILINATGPFLDEVRIRGDRENNNRKPLLDRVAGSHLDIYPALTNESYYVTAGDNRLVFVLKRNEDGLIYTRIGTTERPLKDSESSNSPEPTTGEVDYLIGLALEFFPKATFTKDNILRMDSGIRPLRAQSGLNVFQKSREHEILHEDGVFHVIGVKLTDYRRVASEIFDLIPWVQHGIEPAGSGLSSEFTPLRPDKSEKLYSEESMDEIMNRTMIVHWDDYLYRRRGLLPRLLAKNDPKTLENLHFRYEKLRGS